MGGLFFDCLFPTFNEDAPEDSRIKDSGLRIKKKRQMKRYSTLPAPHSVLRRAQDGSKDGERSRTTLRRLLALVVAEVFLCSSILPAWAVPTDFLRPTMTASSAQRLIGWY